MPDRRPPLANAVCADDTTWSFRRGSHRLEIRSSETAFGFLVTVSVDGLPESNAFRDHGRAERFRSGLEAALFAHGWSFVSFSPNRRAGVDRRHRTRDEDRRRRGPDAGRSITPIKID